MLHGRRFGMPNLGMFGLPLVLAYGQANVLFDCEIQMGR